VCETLRTSVLQHRDATVRIVVLDPGQEEAIRIARSQLDESDDHQIQSLPVALEAMLERLARMRGWRTPGKVEYRLFPYNPGFSLVLTDPDAWQGRAIVELHGAGQSTFARMHVDLTRERHERWYAYWVEQFDYLWETARQVEAPARVPEDS
jgi:PHD/YefM family antitoxin component YafN of YafNO toxin-antitoxin module